MQVAGTYLAHASTMCAEPHWHVSALRRTAFQTFHNFCTPLSSCLHALRFPLSACRRPARPPLRRAGACFTPGAAALCTTSGTSSSPWPPAEQLSCKLLRERKPTGLARNKALSDVPGCGLARWDRLQPLWWSPKAGDSPHYAAAWQLALLRGFCRRLEARQLPPPQLLPAGLSGRLRWQLLAGLA